MEGLHLLDSVASGVTSDGEIANDSWPTVTAAAVGNCSNPLEEVDWSQPGLIISLVILGVVNVLVLFGNCLVVLAVFLDSKLRTVTNLFIVSLAMADLSVGLAVLPFSASLEVLDMWIFGEIWCSIWLAVDVWMCTASILNLCAISLDRYLAVTRPVSYPSIMTPFRAKILLAVVWLLSFVICFPPLVGWNDRKINRHPSQQHCDDWSCELTNDPGYVVYSALGSFFIPMLVMLFFYWRIYRAAVETTKAINQGFRTTKVGYTSETFFSSPNYFISPLTIDRVYRLVNGSYIRW
jgi:octopamine receptor